MRFTHRRSTPHESGPRPSAPARPGAYRPRTRLKGERGYVLVMSALLMLPLLAFAGFAIDIGSWYTHANRMQRAADAAALAAVVWMPNDEKATQVALETAKANGFDNADPDITVTVTPVGNRRVRVHIRDGDVEMYLSSLFLDNMDIERQALAEYVQSVPMGSPDNSLGNDPERWGQPECAEGVVSSACYRKPFYWLNVAAPRGQKHNGDQFTAGDCTGTYSGCSGADNLEYSGMGYFYRLTVDSKPASGDLRVDVFDPAYLEVGNTCNTDNLPTAGSTWNTQAAGLVADGLPADAATRYVRGQTNWCTADSNLGGRNIQTSYVLREPDNTPFDNYDNPIICGMTFGAYNQDVVPLLQSTANRGPEGIPFRDHFRRWYPVCTVPWNDVAVGDYLLQINSTANQSNPPQSLGTHDPTVDTGGYNKYSLRAGFGSPTSATFPTGINFFADGRLPIYVNQSGAGTVTNFWLARIVPEYAGQVLELDLFDVADGANATLTVVPPSDMTGGPLPACTFIRDAAPPTVSTSATCSISGLTNTLYNGRTLTAQIPLPDAYSCNAGSDFGCWFRINLDFGTGSPTDQTTWSARVRGDPVRLVE